MSANHSVALKNTQPAAKPTHPESGVQRVAKRVADPELQLLEHLDLAMVDALEAILRSERV